VLQAAALRAVQAGHDIGSHAAQHLDLTKLAPAEIEQQIAWGSGNISSLTGSGSVPVRLEARRSHVAIFVSAAGQSGIGLCTWKKGSIHALSFDADAGQT
jgi:peptidoglycan/xylan/chitin deacetylase (PgdA/CDA1 family)